MFYNLTGTDYSPGTSQIAMLCFFLCMCYATFLRVFFPSHYMNGMSSKSLGCFFLLIGRGPLAGKFRKGLAREIQEGLAGGQPNHGVVSVAGVE